MKSDRARRGRKVQSLISAKEIRQVGGLDYTEKHSPTPVAASPRIPLATVAMRDMEQHHVGVEQAFVQADVEGEILIEQLEYER